VGAAFFFGGVEKQGRDIGHQRHQTHNNQEFGNGFASRNDAEQNLAQGAEASTSCSSNFRLFGDVNRCGFEESCAQTQGFPFLENACRIARVDNGDLSLREVKGDGSDALGFSKTVRIRFFSTAQSILGTDKIVRWWLSAEVVAVENLLRYFLRSS